MLKAVGSERSPHFLYQLQRTLKNYSGSLHSTYSITGVVTDLKTMFLPSGRSVGGYSSRMGYFKAA